MSVAISFSVSEEDQDFYESEVQEKDVGIQNLGYSLKFEKIENINKQFLSTVTINKHFLSKNNKNKPTLPGIFK